MIKLNLGLLKGSVIAAKPMLEIAFPVDTDEAVQVDREALVSLGYELYDVATTLGVEPGHSCFIRGRQARTHLAHAGG